MFSLYSNLEEENLWNNVLSFVLETVHILWYGEPISYIKLSWIRIPGKQIQILYFILFILCRNNTRIIYLKNLCVVYIQISRKKICEPFVLEAIHILWFGKLISYVNFSWIWILEKKIQILYFTIFFWFFKEKQTKKIQMI